MRRKMKNKSRYRKFGIYLKDYNFMVDSYLRIQCKSYMNEEEEKNIQSRL